MVHNVLRGVFGGWAILLAVLMGYIAVSKTMEQTTMLRGGRLALMVVIVVLFCTAGHVFGSFFPKEKSFFKLVGILYMHGVEQGGAGLVGGLVGELLVKRGSAWRTHHHGRAAVRLRAHLYGHVARELF